MQRNQKHGSRRPDLTNSLAAGTDTLAAKGHSRPGIAFSRPAINDAVGIHKLVERCKPLDLNSTYAYLLLCQHFGSTCVVAKSRAEVIGFVSAYRPPDGPNDLFIWQVAVDPEARGRGLGAEMILRLLARADLREVRHLETTVSPSNLASRHMFQRLARRVGASIQERLLFGRDCFGTADHEEEVLFRIGPLQALTNQGEKNHEFESFRSSGI